MFDFTDSANPVEIAFFDRGPVDAKNLISGGYWSAYWDNGNIYGAEIARGIDVFRLTPSEHLSQNEIDAAILVRRQEFNAQQQPKVEWPATVVVARAYLDQLNRSKSITTARATAVKNALDHLDRAGRDRAALDRIDAVATQLEQDASAATVPDADRLRSLAATDDAGRPVRWHRQAVPPEVLELVTAFMDPARAAPAPQPIRRTNRTVVLRSITGVIRNDVYSQF